MFQHICHHPFWRQNISSRLNRVTLYPEAYLEAFRLTRGPNRLPPPPRGARRAHQEDTSEDSYGSEHQLGPPATFANQAGSQATWTALGAVRPTGRMDFIAIPQVLPPPVAWAGVGPDMGATVQWRQDHDAVGVHADVPPW